MGDILSGSKQLLNLFPVFKRGRAHQVFLLEFIKNGLAVTVMGQARYQLPVALKLQQEKTKSLT